MTKQYTVLVYPEPIEYEIEAENEQQAELIARNNYSYEGDGNERVEVITMQVLSMKDFNLVETNKYLKACDIAIENNEALPYRGFYGFFNNQGNLLTSGYVAFDDRGSYRAKTKKLAIYKFKQARSK